MAKTLALSLSNGCFQNYISLVFEDKQTHRDGLKCLVVVSSAGWGSKFKTKTDRPTDPLQFPPLYNKKTQSRDIYEYLWPMRKTSQGLQSSLAFCSDRLRLTVELCTDGRTSKEFNCHKSRRYTVLAAVERDLASSPWTLHTMLSVYYCVIHLCKRLIDISKFTYPQLS